MLLAEVGEVGQERIVSASVRLTAGAGVEVAADYLTRAGAAEVLIAAEGEAPRFAHGQHFRHAPSHEVGRGAWQALTALRTLLGDRLAPEGVAGEAQGT